MSIEVENKADLVQQLRETFHDMRQPVANTMALAAAALTEPALPAVARDRLEQIVEQAEWLADMIHSCLVAQQQEEPDDIEKPGHDLADIVHVVGEVIAAECLTWPGDVMLTAPAGPVWCMFDPVLLRRAVSNVLGNAMRAAGPTGTVSVEIQQRDGAVMLAVEDNGPVSARYRAAPAWGWPPRRGTSSSMAGGWNMPVARGAGRASAYGLLKSKSAKRSGAGAACAL